VHESAGIQSCVPPVVDDERWLAQDSNSTSPALYGKCVHLQLQIARYVACSSRAHRLFFRVWRKLTSGSRAQQAARWRRLLHNDTNLQSNSIFICDGTGYRFLNPCSRSVKSNFTATLKPPFLVQQSSKNASNPSPCDVVSLCI
jgi:hypothetical protein